MQSWNEFIQTLAKRDAGAPATETGAPARIGDVEVARGFGDRRAEFQAAMGHVAITDRSYRSVLTVSGTDRVAWLHNLVTQDVKSICPGDGQYAFALNVKGRILFDLNVFVRTDEIQLDLDHRFRSAARAHLEKYVIMEDVTLAEPLAGQVRLGLVGPSAGAILAQAGMPQAPNLAILQSGSFVWQSAPAAVVRGDFCGPPAWEVSLPADRAIEFWQWCTDQAGAAPMGFDVAEALRIEAGIPAPATEINENVLPAETGQLARAVSFSKGCYLGQEVVERMRSRGVTARHLVRLTLTDPTPPPAGAEVLDAENQPVGRVTSACRRMVEPGCLALGYVKTVAATPGTELVVTDGDRRLPATVTPAPVPADG